LDLTEGWFVGVKIALLVVKDHGTTAIDEFDGSQPDLMNYFGTEVYQSLSESDQTFFLESAIFDRFNVPVCDYVLGRSDSHLIVGDLIDQSVFIVEDSSKRGWYRYHSLLKEFMRKKLADDYDQDRLISLHLKCVDGFIQQADYEQAIYHAFQSGVKVRIDQVLLDACYQWMKVGGFVQIIKSLDQLTENELYENRKLAIIYGYSLVFSRRFNQAQFYLNELKQYYQSLPEARLLDDVAYLELSLKLLQRDIENISKQQVDDLLESAYTSDIRTFSLIIAAYFELHGGCLSEALAIAHKAKAILACKGHVFLESYADLIIALCDRYMGRGIEAVNYISNIYAKTRFKKGGLPWVSLTTAMMVVSYEQNQLKKAISLCEQLIPCLNHTCVTEVISTVYLNYSRLLFISGDQKKAVRLLDQLDRILILGKYERFTSQTLFESMRQAYLARDGVRARHLLERHNLHADMVDDVEINGRFNEAAERSVLSWALASSLNGEFDLAQSVLTKLTVKLQKLGLVSRMIVARCNIVVLEYNKGQKRSAVAMLKQLLSECGFTGFSRNTFDEAPYLYKVFQYAEEVSEFSVPQLFKSVYLDLFSGQPEKPSLFPIMSLTEKELQVYNLLSEGLSNAEISRETGVALSTTKWHLKNIYQKLGVANRAEAIVKKQTVLDS
jgi:LuxR family maltose regulon positive regulatory protein